VLALFALRLAVGEEIFYDVRHEQNEYEEAH
jgi:hypothetical protein